MSSERVRTKEAARITGLDLRTLQEKAAAGLIPGDPGRCFIRAGFAPIACTVNNRLLVLQMLPDAMPDPKPLAWPAPSLFGTQVAA